MDSSGPGGDVLGDGAEFEARVALGMGSKSVKFLRKMMDSRSPGGGCTRRWRRI